MVTQIPISDRDRMWLKFSFVATFLWGLAAHSYAFLNSNFSWDSLNELHGAIFGNAWRIQLGRYFVPLYRDLLRSDVTLPWLIGLLSLVFLSLTVFFVVRLFRVESRVTAFLIAGIFTTNTSVCAAAATYIHDLDCFMLSLACAAAAVYLWRMLPKGWLWGVPLITISLGMYQSFVFTAAALVMIASILDLMNGKAFREVFGNGLKAVAMVLLGGILYYIGLKLTMRFSGEVLSTGTYNSMDSVLGLTLSQIPSLATGAYQDCFSRFWVPDSTYPAILVRLMLVCLGAVSAAAVLVWLCSRKSGWGEKLLCLLLIVLLPLVMNLLYVLTLGESHDLMVFAIWLFYLLALLLADWLAARWKEGKRLSWAGCWQQRLCLLLVAVLMYGNVQFANGMYLKKDLEHDAYLSAMTRVAVRMEDYEGYIPGQTPVVMLGTMGITNLVMPGFKDYWDVTGMQFSDPVVTGERNRVRAYFDYILGTTVLLAEEEIWEAMQDDVSLDSIPAYPSKDCVQMRDGILLVRVGPTYR